MSEAKKGVWPAIIVLGVAGSFIAGTQIRLHQDLGSTPKTPSTLNVASIELPTDSPKNIPESEYFYQLTLLLERDFVDPVTDEDKLAYGAVKGMIGGLWDPLSQFFPKDHLAEHFGRLKGQFAGIGVEIRTVFSPHELEKVRTNSRSADPLMLIPELQVAFVAPGSPAEKAGITVGSRIERINGRWLLAWRDVKKLRDLQAQVTAGKASAADFKKIRVDIQKKAKDSMTVSRALDLLTSGADRTVSIQWILNGKSQTASVTSALTTVPAMRSTGGSTYALRMFEGASKEVANLHLPAGAQVTLDLRNSSLGDSREIEPVLKELAPHQEFGQFEPEKGGQARTLMTSEGRNEPLRLKLIVDESTRGAAAVLALALSAKNGAELVGKPNAEEAVWIETVKLGDGSGYTLNTGQFHHMAQGALR